MDMVLGQMQRGVNIKYGCHFTCHEDITSSGILTPLILNPCMQ
jgi:hypothetical protein